MDLVSYRISPECIVINNSYRVKRKQRAEMIDIILNKCDDSYPIKQRSRAALLLEWSAHNLLYKLHYKRSHTKSVDLDIWESRWHLLLYVPLGIIGWLF